jgi:ATP-dependent Clp protease protease subunit
MPIGIKYSQKLTKKPRKKHKPKSHSGIGLLLCGELCDETIRTVWEAYDNNKNFLLTLCSPGGDIIVYHALLDFLEIPREEGRLSTLAMGECASGAPLLVAGGSPGKRYSYKNTLFGLHEPFLGNVPDDPGAQHSLFEQLNYIKQQYYKFLSDLTKRKEAWWKEKLSGQSMWNITAKEAKDFGIIDEII